MQLELDTQVALVTGSNRGTGLVIARQLAAEGATVLLHGLTAPGADDEARLLAESGAAAFISGDITRDGGAAEVIAAARELGHLPTILVNNYGTAVSGNWSDSSNADWIEAYSKNTLSAAQMSQQCIPVMRTAGFGRIINLGTIGSTRPNSRMPHYYAAKGALATMTVSLAKELKGTGITVNLVSPGLIRTPEVEEHYGRIARDKGWGDDFASAEQRLAEHYFPNPLERFATREEVADLVVFLASRQAAFINSQNIRVDGGAVDIV